MSSCGTRMALGIDRGGPPRDRRPDWDPRRDGRRDRRTSVREPTAFDLLLFGNESADTGGYQVGIRVAHALGLPCVTGVKALDVGDGTRPRGARPAAAGSSSSCRCPRS